MRSRESECDSLAVVQRDSTNESKPFQLLLLWKLINVVFGMSGLRLDRWRDGRVFSLWVLGWLGCIGLFYAAFEFRWVVQDPHQLRLIALGYAALTWVAYYVFFLAIGLGSPLRQALIDRWGEGPAYAIYEAGLGVVFLNQGLSQVAIMKAYDVSFPEAVPAWALLFIGGGCVILGFFWKAWATFLTGLDTYYYRDMFLGRSTYKADTEEYVVTGPYRFGSNPMYGIGNLQAYGGALWFGSWQGLVVAGLFQLSIYLFYFLFERPFVVRVYQTA